MNELASGYVRTSKEKDDAFSLDSQIEAIRHFAVANNITVPPEYEFREEFTGKLLERPKLTLLRSLIKERSVTALIVYATDRLSRKVGVADILLDELFSYGIKLYIVAWGTYVKDTPEDRLRFNFEATFSDFERRKIAERVNRGKIHKVSQGLYLGTGNPPYGYQKVGKKREIHLEIIEEQAEIIRQIFRWYATEHVGVEEIMRRLRGIPTPSETGKAKFAHKLRGLGEWADATIYIILKNPAYMGSMQLFGYTISVPAIIDTTLFDLAQEQLARGRQESFRNQRYEYLMGRRLKCSLCGYAIQGHPHGVNGVIDILYYRCPSWRPHKAKPKCGLPGFRVDQVDAAVWEWVRNLILHPESLRVMLEESQKELQEHTHDLKFRLMRVEDRLKDEGKRLAVLLREYIDIEARGDTSEAASTIREVYRQAKEQSEQLFTELSQERDKLSAELSGASIDDTLIEDLTEFAETVRDDIDNLPYAGRREIIETLNVRGELAFEEGRRVVYIVWYTHTFRSVLTLFKPSCDPKV
jgi:site-specific DNA recombinase